MSARLVYQSVGDFLSFILLFILPGLGKNDPMMPVLQDFGDFFHDNDYVLNTLRDNRISGFSAFKVYYSQSTNTVASTLSLRVFGRTRSDSDHRDWLLTSKSNAELWNAFNLFCQKFKPFRTTYNAFCSFNFYAQMR